jgi:hypothetical protein
MSRFETGETISKPQKIDRRARDTIRAIKREPDQVGRRVISRQIEEYPSLESIEQTLQELIAQETNERGKQNFDGILGIYPEGLAQVYKKTPRYQDRYNQAQEIVGNQSADNQLQTSVNNLSGTLFNDIAYTATALREAPHRLVLSPERTAALYDAIYPDRRTRFSNSPFFETGLRGTTVPDGVLINKQGDRPKIIGLYEYSARTFQAGAHKVKSPIYEKQLEELSGQYPTIFSSDAHIIFVTPAVHSNIVLPDMGAENVEIQQIPFTRGDLGEFTNEVVNKISAGDVVAAKTSDFSNTTIIPQTIPGEDQPHTPQETQVNTGQRGLPPEKTRRQTDQQMRGYVERRTRWNPEVEARWQQQEHVLRSGRERWQGHNSSLTVKKNPSK